LSKDVNNYKKVKEESEQIETDRERAGMTEIEKREKGRDNKEGRGDLNRGRETRERRKGDRHTDGRR
jgi:hypothetical protein